MTEQGGTYEVCVGFLQKYRCLLSSRNIAVKNKMNLQGLKT